MYAWSLFQTTHFQSMKQELGGSFMVRVQAKAVLAPPMNLHRISNCGFVA